MLDEPEIPRKDIVIRYSHTNFNKPHVTANKNSEYISFIPELDDRDDFIRNSCNV